MYALRFARPVEKHVRSLLDLPVSWLFMQPLLRFRMDCYVLPKDVAAWASIPRLQRFCNMCQHRTIGDEKHLVFECPALQALPDKCPHLCEGMQADAIVLSMWQDDMIGVVRHISKCIKRVLNTSDQP